jgi:hypothetical protein
MDTLREAERVRLEEEEQKRRRQEKLDRENGTATGGYPS